MTSRKTPNAWYRVQWGLRVRVCARAGSRARGDRDVFARAGKKRIFFAMMELMLKCRFTCGGVDILFFQCKMLFCNKTSYV